MCQGYHVCKFAFFIHDLTRESSMPSIPALETLDIARFDSPAILKKLAIASRKLAELKGIAASIPNQHN